MYSQKPERLREAVAAVCPIHGLDIGAPGDAATVKVLFDAAATDDQRIAAREVVSAFDWSDAADAAAREARERDEILIEAKERLAADPALVALRETIAEVLGSKTADEIQTLAVAKLDAQIGRPSARSARMIAAVKKFFTWGD